jgi:transcriptional regulator with GAF, ATPase, and Fis domain
MSSLKEKIMVMERQAIIEALIDCDWVMARAARKLGITERMIGYKVKKYGIKIKGVAYGTADLSIVEVDDRNNKKDS